VHGEKLRMGKTIYGIGGQQKGPDAALKNSIEKTSSKENRGRRVEREIAIEKQSALEKIRGRDRKWDVASCRSKEKENLCGELGYTKDCGR